LTPVASLFSVRHVIHGSQVNTRDRSTSLAT
jgi:hypothetical protein